MAYTGPFEGHHTTDSVSDDAIHVTKAVVPDPAVYGSFLEQILSSRQLTNSGVFCRTLEQKLTEFLAVPHLGLCSNGTLALQLALRASGLAGKRVVTTPFSYVATVSALLWEGCTPVFADIDEETLCLDPRTVPGVLDDSTAGMMPVHMYGNICDVNALGALAADSGLTVIYDAAQCFGSEYQGRSVLDYGEYATCSFHATKVFHTVEGGGVVSHRKQDHDAINLLRACGHIGDTHYRLGINAKLSELHAAMGLGVLAQVRGNIAGRKRVSDMYDALLPRHGLRRPALRQGLVYNYAYYPIILDDEKTTLRVIERLNKGNIFPRRYFYPALNTLPYLPSSQACPVAEDICRRVLCLPLYAELAEGDVERIVHSLRSAM